MKAVSVAALVTVLSITVFGGDIVGFDDQEVGSVPIGWVVAATGQGASRWRVEEGKAAPSPSMVLKQSGVAAYPLCVKNDPLMEDGFVEVKFKPLTGKEDQAAGIVWRFRDANNYYIVRANALEDNVVLYKVENGKRSSLNIVGREEGYGVDAKVLNGKWQILRLEFTGNLFTVSLEGKELFRVMDQTFQEAGKIGLWTKADSVTLFDDFSYGER